MGLGRVALGFWGLGSAVLLGDIRVRTRRLGI